MKTHTTPPRAHEFSFPHLDTLVCVDQTDEIVIIRATRDTFSESRKESFIHELAAEGFIDDSYQRFSFTDPDRFRPLRWWIDISWLGFDAEMTARTRRFALSLLGGAAALWLGLMAMLFLRAAG